jgi:hypothetical protein
MWIWHFFSFPNMEVLHHSGSTTTINIQKIVGMGNFFTSFFSSSIPKKTLDRGDKNAFAKEKIRN